MYELSGSEVCFSTGDLIKVVGIELQSVSCEDVGNEDKFELPINHTGQWFSGENSCSSCCYAVRMCSV